MARAPWSGVWREHLHAVCSHVPARYQVLRYGGYTHACLRPLRTRPAPIPQHQAPGRPVAWCRPSGWLAWNGGTPERRRNLDMPASTRMQLSNAAGDFPSSHQLPSVERHASPRDAPGGLDRNNWACGLWRARPGVPGSAWSTTRRTRRPRGVIERGAGAQRWRGGLLHRASHTPRDPPAVDTNRGRRLLGTYRGN
jgi:hypothetical protein